MKDNKQIFEVGDLVVSLESAISELEQPRTKGRVYPVLDVQFCPKTGQQKINVSGYIPSGIGLHTRLYNCSCGTSHNSYGKWWSKSSRFAPLEQAALDEAVENEEYEVAAILRDALEEQTNGSN